LTANAVVGQANVFLSKGFDDYISKPIDVRQLNSILKKFVRNKQSARVLEEAQSMVDEMNPDESRDMHLKSPDEQLLKIFLRDAENAVKILEEVMEKGTPIEEQDLRNYVINVHGLKSALTNIGEDTLSSVASNLEDLGRENNFEAVFADTPSFLDSIKACMKKIAQPLEPRVGEGIEESDETKKLLAEKLKTIQDACNDFDKKTADDALEELSGAQLSNVSKELLERIAELLLYSDFDAAVELIDKFSPS